MKIHITNLYNFNANDQLVKQQHRFADAGRSLGFYEMGIFSYPVETDTPSELSKRLDGIIAALEAEDVVIMQLPTRNGFQYEKKLFDKIKAYRNTKIVLLFHDMQMFSQDELKNYMELCKRAEVVILPSDKDLSRFQKEGIVQLLSCEDVCIADKVSGRDGSNERIDVIESAGYASLCQEDFYIKKILLDIVEKVYLYQKKLIKDTTFAVEDEIQIGFGLHDKTGNYSVWVGAAMQSIIEHTNSKICFHLLIDDSVNEANKKKLTQVAWDGGHRIRFHLLDKNEFLHLNSQVKHFTIGTMFRIMLPEILPELSRIIYLDADIIVNRDIKELWDIDIRDYCMAAVPDRNVNSGKSKPFPIIQNDVLPEQYFNAGVLYINLGQIRKKGSMKTDVLSYLNVTSGSQFPDQDALNVIYKDRTLLLDSSWNYFVMFVREKNSSNLENKIYHFAGTRCLMYEMSIADQLCFETVGRTPWGIEKNRELLSTSFGRLRDHVRQLEKVLSQLSASDKKRIFYGSEVYAMRNMYKLLHIREGDYRVLAEPVNYSDSILQCKSLSVLEEEKDEYIVFVLPEADGGTSIRRLEQMGLVNERDFFVIPRLLPPELGGYI